MKRTTKIRYAIVGLGHLAQVAILPAFRHARRSELAALVSGDSAKGRVLSKKFRVPTYGYDDFELAVKKERIDAAFIVLPNTQHRRFTERAAKFGDAWYPVSNNQSVKLNTPPKLRAGIEGLHRVAEKVGRDPGSIDVGFSRPRRPRNSRKLST